MILYLKIAGTRTSASNVGATAGTRRQLTNTAALRGAAFLRRATLSISSAPVSHGSGSGYTYFNGTRTGTCVSNELASACIVRVHAKSATRTRTACLGYAALDTGGITGAIAG